MSEFASDEGAADTGTTETTETESHDTPDDQGNHDDNGSDTKPDKPKPTKHKIKSNGREEELDLEELIKRAELASGANEKFQKASAKEKALQERLDRWKNPDEDVLEDLLDLLGPDKLLNLSGKLHPLKLQWEQMSQEDRDALIEREEAEAAKAELKAIKDGKASEAAQAQQLQAYQVINDEIGAVIEDARKAGVPLADLPEMTESIANEMLAVLETLEAEEKAGRHYSGKIPSAKEIFESISARYEDRTKTYLGKLDAKTLKSMLTPQQLQALRQEELDTLYGSTPNRTTPSQSASSQQAQIPKTMNEVFKSLDQKYGVKK